MDRIINNRIGVLEGLHERNSHSGFEDGGEETPMALGRRAAAG